VHAFGVGRRLMGAASEFEGDYTSAAGLRGELLRRDLGLVAKKRSFNRYASFAGGFSWLLGEKILKSRCSLSY